jgi:hypothetical protein
MIEISKNSNPNYLCKIFKIENLRPHSNADRLQITSIDFQDIVVGLDVKEGDVMVFFPLECKINSDFLSFTNSFRKKELNADKEKAGFFEENCRVKAVKFRNEKSMGYLVPSVQVSAWSGYNIIKDDIGQEFDTIGGKKLVEKYFVPVTQSDNVKQGKKPKLSRLVEGQVHLHISTENLRKNIHKINPEDTISITYKTHGTSWWVSNVVVNRQLNIFERLLKSFGVKINTKYFDIIYGSRKVVKNKHFDPKGKDHYFGYDLWADIKDQVADKIPKGYTLYGECLGYTKNGSPIQGSSLENSYDYGCIPVLPDYASKTHYNKVWKNYYSKTEQDNILTKYNIVWDKPYVPNLNDLDVDITNDIDLSRDSRKQSKLEVYRITHTTPDGLVTELSYPEIAEFCERVGLTPSHLFYYGKVFQFLPNLKREGFNYDERNWREQLIKYLESKYNEKDCFMCKNTVAEEGIVLRKESLFNCESYKLKSFRFLKSESDQLDKGISSIEEEN